MVLPIWLLRLRLHDQRRLVALADRRLVRRVGGAQRRGTTAMREALELVPDDASVAATYTLLPHLSHREQIYDWPNPWVPAYWGNDDGYRLPDPSTIDYIVLDRTQVGEAQQPLVADLIAPGGPYEVLFDGRRCVWSARRKPGR